MLGLRGLSKKIFIKTFMPKKDLRIKVNTMLVRNLFLSLKDREEWKGMVPTMKVADLKKLIAILEKTEADFKSFLLEVAKRDPEHKVIQKLKAYGKVMRKEIADTEHEKEVSEAEEGLKNALNN